MSDEAVGSVENVSPETIEPPVDAVETPPEGSESEVVTDAPVVEDAAKIAQERAGRAISAQRKLFAEQVDRLKQENEQLKQRNAMTQSHTESAQYDPNRMVYDPRTEAYYSFDDPNPAVQAIAANVWREQEAEKKQKVRDSQKIYTETADRIMAGQAVYDNYDQSMAIFQQQGTNDIAAALTGSDDPAKLVHFLGNNPQELQRLSQLPPHRVPRAIAELELALEDQKKLITKAKSPIDHLSEPKNKMKPPEAQSYEERAEYWSKTLNSHRET